MKHTTSSISDTIKASGLPTREQKALYELMRHRNHPLILGYLVYVVGALFAIAFFYCFVLIFRSISLELDVRMEEMGKAMAMLLFLSIFLMSGAQTYMNRIRASRAVSELLMTKDTLQNSLHRDNARWVRVLGPL